MNPTWSRRNLLKSALVSLPLPLLSSQWESYADSNNALQPIKTAFLFLPNGAVQSSWSSGPTPTIGSSRPLKLGPSTASLEPYFSYCSYLQGTAMEPANDLGDGPGDHARSASSFLTAHHPRKTSSPPLASKISIDQIISQHFKSQYQVPSIHLAIEESFKSGSCDSGYHCSYSEHISWKTPQTPVENICIPSEVFIRLFGSYGNQTPEQIKQVWRDKKSVLDTLLQQIKKLKQHQSPEDSQLIDDYTYSIREIEREIQLSLNSRIIKPDMPFPINLPDTAKDHRRQLYQLIALAFRYDLCPVATYMLGKGGSGIVYKELGLKEGHHSISHHGEDPLKIADLRKIDTLMMEDLAFFCQELEKGKGANWNGLQQCQILLGSAIDNGQYHNHDNLPIWLLGQANGKIKGGQHIHTEKKTPLANLYLKMLEHLGLSISNFGNSTGKVELS